jgi:hypothetical protein
MSIKYKKFELEDLPKSAVVNSLVRSQDIEVDEIINEAVSEHLSKIIDESQEDKNLSDYREKDVEDSSEYHNISADFSLKQAEEVVDLEAIKEEFYQKGRNDATLEYEERFLEKQSVMDLSKKLLEKLELIVQSINIDSQIAKVASEIILGIADKLHLILPADFEKIIRESLGGKLKDFYREGKIILTVHPDRHDLCLDIFLSDEILDRFSNNFQIVEDNKLGKDDFILDCNETRLEYNKEQLRSEINKIIKQLKSIK